jgi:hypothetical protein
MIAWLSHRTKPSSSTSVGTVCWGLIWKIVSFGSSGGEDYLDELGSLVLALCCIDFFQIQGQVEGLGGHQDGSGGGAWPEHVQCGGHRGVLDERLSATGEVVPGWLFL